MDGHGASACGPECCYHITWLSAINGAAGYAPQLLPEKAWSNFSLFFARALPGGPNIANATPQPRRYLLELLRVRNIVAREKPISVHNPKDGLIGRTSPHSGMNLRSWSKRPGAAGSHNEQILITHQWGGNVGALQWRCSWTVRCPLVAILPCSDEGARPASDESRIRQVCCDGTGSPYQGTCEFRQNFVAGFCRLDQGG